eukprot:2472878-Prymnesium_polylepis.1
MNTAPLAQPSRRHDADDVVAVNRALIAGACGAGATVLGTAGAPAGNAREREGPVRPTCEEGA